jgi:hypothetical protein
MPILVSAFAAIACIPNQPVAPYAALGSTAEPLHAAFNADTGRVRVVMLVSPT